MKIVILSVIAALFTSVGSAQSTNVSGASGIAVNGYDTVAFFTQEKAVHGNPSISAEYEGAVFLFSAERHKQLFINNPEKYAPQFGGYCAYGAAVGQLFPVDVAGTWQIVNGKLYLNLNPAIVKAFNADQKANIQKAEANWPKLKRKAAKGA